MDATPVLVTFSLYLSLAIWLFYRCLKSSAGSVIQTSVGLILTFAIMFAPFADEVAGEIYLSRQCKAVRGVEFTGRKVQAGLTLFWPDGSPKWIARDRSYQESQRVTKIQSALRRAVAYKVRLSERYVFVRIWQQTVIVLAAGTGEVLAQYSYMGRSGGWFSSMLPFGPLLSTKTCPNIESMNVDAILERVIEFNPSIK